MRIGVVGITQEDTEVVLARIDDWHVYTIEVELVYIDNRMIRKNFKRIKFVRLEELV